MTACIRVIGPSHMKCMEPSSPRIAISGILEPSWPRHFGGWALGTDAHTDAQTVACNIITHNRLLALT